MMEFDRSKDTLRALSSKDSVTLEDALGIFIDLCEDLKGSGTSIENLDIVNTDKLLANLSRSGRVFLKIMKKNAETIERVDIGGRVKKQETQIEVQSAELDEKERMLDDFEVRVRAQIEALEQRKKVCESRVAALDEKRQYLIRLEEECNELQMTIDRTESMSVQPLEEKRITLQTKIENQKRELQELQENIESFESDLATFNQRVSETQIEQQEKMQACTDALRNVEQLEQDIKERSERIRELSEKEKDKRGLVEDLKQRQNRLNADVVLLQNDIDRLREHLANSDFEKLKIEKEELLKEKMELDEVLSKEKLEYEQLKQAMYETQEERTAQKESFEKEQSRILDNNLHLKEKIDKLSEENEAKTKERAMLEKALADVEERQGQLRKWFETLDMSQYDARIKQAQQRINMFEDAQKALFYEMDELNLAQTVSNQEANEKREELRLALKQIETMLEDYRTKYKMICELLSD